MPNVTYVHVISRIAHSLQIAEMQKNIHNINNFQILLLNFSIIIIIIYMLQKIIFKINIFSGLFECIQCYFK